MCDFFRCHGICFGDDGDDVDFVVEALHELDVEGLEAVARRRHEVQATVDPAVRDHLPVHPRLGV